MADLSAAVDPGSGHLLGHVLGDGQTASMAPHHVSTSKCVRGHTGFSSLVISSPIGRRQPDRTAAGLSGTKWLNPLTTPAIELHRQTALSPVPDSPFSSASVLKGVIHMHPITKEKKMRIKSCERSRKIRRRSV